MSGFNRASATLAYLVLVLVLGGASAAGFSGNLLLQVLGAGLIGWTLWSAAPDEAISTGLRPFLIALAVLMAIQFLPLPPGVWGHLPGREGVYQGFVTLGASPPWLTLSLGPWRSLASFVWWIPALALFVSLRGEGAPAPRQVIWAITGVAVISIAFGAMQRIVGSAYFYTITNFGEGPGFFANSNHQGSFMLAALALFGGWLAQVRAARSRRGPGRSTFTVLAMVAVLLAIGVLVSGSLACFALLAPVLGALVVIALPNFRLPLPLILAALLLVGGGIVAFLIYGPVANDLTAKGVVAGISRHDFLVTGSHILRDFAPLGSGSGTFVDLYRWYEDPAQVGTTFVNHAHDDLLETLIETGLFGLVAVILFLVWYVPRALRLWTGQRDHPVALAASVLIGVELLHSLVDYPLRTAAMSSLVAVACVLLMTPREPRKSNRAVITPEVGEAPRGMIRI